MIILTVDEVIKIHGRLIEKTGGLDGLRDRGLLETAIFNISLVRIAGRSLTKRKIKKRRREER